MSEDQGLLRIDVEVSSPLHAAARIRKGRGVTQMGTSTAVAHAHAQPEDLDLRSGNPMFMLKSDSASPGIGDRLLPSHHQCSRTDTAKPGEIHMGERRRLPKETRPSPSRAPNTSRSSTDQSFISTTLTALVNDV